MLEVVFFKTEAGNEPVRDWLKTLSPGDRRVIGADLRTVQMGFPIGMPLCRPLGQGLYEVRSSLESGNEARVLFFVVGSEIVIVHGFIKKTNTTPDAVLKLARKRKKAYESV